MANQSKSPAKIIVIFTALMVLIVAALIYVNQAEKNKLAEIESEKAEQFKLNPPSTEGQPTLGNVESNVTVVEFGDYKCPSCKIWEQMIFPQLKADYIDTGKINYAFINTLFHQQESVIASLAAEAVYAQDPEAYWDFHQAIYELQPDVNHDEAWVTIDAMTNLAAETVPSLDLQKFQEDMAQNAFMNNLNIDMGLVQYYEVMQTPTIMVNGTKIQEFLDYEELKGLIEAELQ
ncbi:DsbA family protein [Longirhabdus pacifica]|uniref:DsbA family protein n=1 Tax=Longirhabdus pacifica TaxID=2305227 RepID=UPI0010091218|nr:thioredoxin domain-containing protein [Longirhabdus pacifica]